MQIPEAKWYDAIFRRRSRRQFNRKVLSQEIVNHFLDFSRELEKNIDGARAVIITSDSDKVFRGAIGSFGKIRGASAYVAFIGNMEDLNVQEKVGYIGECFILEATFLGLATCWVGGFFRPDVVKSQITIKHNEQVLAVSPLGYAPEKYSSEEKLMSGFPMGHKRKKMESLCLNGFNREWPDWIISALEAARMAPSAVNRQPWRFSVEEDDSIKISVDSLRDPYRISKRLDCGIAMVHIEVGAGHKGVRGRWEYLQNSDVAIFKVEQ